MKRFARQRLGRLMRAVAAAGLAMACAAVAAQAAPTGHGIVTMTRGVKVFGDAEMALLEAIKAHDSAAIDRLLAPEFEQRSQSAPGDPEAREDWLAQAPAEVAHSAGVREMAVHEYGDLAIASFLWERDRPLASAFVVDVWRRKTAADPYQLVTRYLSPLPLPAAAARRHRGAGASGPASASVDTKK